MQDKIFAVLVPKERKIKVKNGKRTVIEEKIFPGYILVEMIVTDDSWYVVRNTPNVTGFVGSGTTPTPIDQKEMDELQKRMGVEDPSHKIDIEVDQPVRIVDGPFKNFEGKVSNVDEARGKIKVLVAMFGRETPVELDALQVKKI
jgi:transcriptional antiterminator NusG